MNLRRLLKPRSIAVVGASESKEKIGSLILENLKSFKGKVYPVNPKYNNLNDLKCYPVVDAIKNKVDIAVIAIPSQHIPFAMKHAKNARNIVIISSGFSETGNKELASEVLAIARKNRQRILGPNCIGIQIPRFNLNATFAPRLAKPGSVAFISQSGGFGSAMLDWAYQERIGFSAFVSVGNMLDTKFYELLHYFEADKSTKAIALYVEGLKDGRMFLDVARKCKKPIIVFKAGKTKEGIKSASTHTGSLAGDYLIHKGVFKQARVIEAKTTSELFDLVKALSLVKKPKNNKVVILTNSGGPGTAAADQIAAPLELHKEVIDLTGSATSEAFKDAFKSLKKVDANFLVTYVPTEVADPCEIASLIADFAKKKTVVASFLGGSIAYQCSAVFKSRCAAHFETPERALNVLKKLV